MSFISNSIFFLFIIVSSFFSSFCKKALRKTIKRYFIVSLFLYLPFIAFSQAPVAGFSSDITSGCKPIVVNFKDLSSNNPTNWNWDLGNGTVSTAQNPVTTYLIPGTYQVTLTAKNINGSSTIVKSGYITIYDVPVADFFSNDTSGCSPLLSRFADKSDGLSGAITQWDWAFGDGGNSKLQNPSYTYNNIGTYNVSLKVTNSRGCSNVAFKPQYVKAGGVVISEFSASIPPYCNLPVNVSFSNQSNGSDSLSYIWNFGDGGSSNAESPNHNFSGYGSFNVSLVTVSPGGCSDTVSRVVTLPARFVDFSGPSVLCTGASGTFSVTSSPAPLYTTWKMGDGSTFQTSTVSHVYPVPGTYVVTLINDFGDCIDSVSKNITVTTGLSVNFTSADTGSCKAPFTVNFTDQSPGATTWAWDFGDGSTSAIQNPVHTYNAKATYNVSLKVTGSDGCTSIITKSNFIKIKTPAVKFTNVPANGCIPFAFTPQYKIDNADPITSYYWDFGDGTNSAASNPSHTYVDSGFYTIKLIITTAGGCTDSAKAINGVRAGIRNNPLDFTFSPAVVCGSENVKFTPIATGNIFGYRWFFGDGTSSTVQSPVHNYTDTGSLTLRLDVNFGGCTSSVVKTTSIRINGPIPKYIFQKDCANIGLVHFINKSIDPSSFQWDFGDGSTSTVVNPNHTYAVSGNYKVTLKAIRGCSDTVSYTIPIWTEKIAVKADKNSVCKGDSIIFTITHPSPSNVVSYNFNVTGNAGDTFKSSLSNTLKWAYQASGDYKITAFTVDKFGCRDTIVMSEPIRVNGPLAKFGVKNSSLCTGQIYNFNDSSQTDGVNPIKEWQWNFGDSISQTYTSAPFTHMYSNPGVYSIKLLVKDQLGCTDTLTKKNLIVAYRAEARFISVDSFSCPGKRVRFADQSVGSIFSRLWDFGDGSTSSDVNPFHIYNSKGTYTVKLIIFSSGGCVDSLIKPNLITIDNPIARFSLGDSISNCPPLLVNFRDSSYYVQSYRWDLGDGSISSLKNPAINYFLPNKYIVKLIATSPGGCKDSAYATIRVAGPNGIITYTPTAGCAPFNVKLKVKTTGVKSYTWDYGDGFTSSGTDSSSSHIYNSEGKFLPKVIITNSEGCSVSISGTDTVFVESPITGFFSANRIVCDTAAVSFIDTSKAMSALTYVWLFGDGSISNAKNPVHNYVLPGNYTIKLTTTSPLGCKDSAIVANYIKVIKPPSPTIVADSSVCAGNVSFSLRLVSDTSAIAAYLWKFGNGNSSALVNPPAQSFTEGSYTNSVTVTNSTGCAATVSNPLVVHPVPVISLSNDTTICLSDTIQISVSGGSSYNWVSNTNALSCTACNNPLAFPATDDVYNVTAYSLFNCVTKDSVVVKVLQPFTLNATAGYTVCKGQSVQLNAAGAPLYLWTPITGLSSVSVANPIASPSATTVYTVKGYDSLGCTTNTATVTVNVYNYPTVNLGADRTLILGKQISVSPVVSNDVVKYLWVPSTYLSCSTCLAPEITAMGNITYRLIVTNEAGCATEDTLRIIVSCGNSTLYIPNTFSPNHDGVNDLFYIRGKGISSVQSITIINRFGEAVFQKRNITPDNTSDGWDGTYKGRDSETGVYVYYVELFCNGEVIRYTGNISLIR